MFTIQVDKVEEGSSCEFIYVCACVFELSIWTFGSIEDSYSVMIGICWCRVPRYGYIFVQRTNSNGRVFPSKFLLVMGIGLAYNFVSYFENDTPASEKSELVLC